MKIVIVGGVAGGMSAATRLRRLNEDAEIIVLDKGPYVSFANCGLPYYISGDIQDRSKLIVQTPEKLEERFELDVRPNSEVTEIDRQNKEVLVQIDSESYRLSYDKLILSPGARPLMPPIQGLEEAGNIFTLRTVPDVDQIKAYIEEAQPKKAVVIGAGFIGLEMVESLAHQGLEVALVEQAPHILPTLDEEMAAFISEELQDKGVQVYTGKAAQIFEDQGQTVVLDDGHRLDSDLTILSIGVRPESQLAEDAGLEIGLRQGIKVNENYQTNDPDIFAVGDAIIVNQTITNQEALISLASPANRQGRQVADVISGVKRKNKGSIGTAIVRVFNRVAASTGLTEKQAEEAGLTYRVIHASGQSHASYYPGSEYLLLKLIFNPESGEIYGAQGIGGDGVDKRIDVLATAIKGGIPADELMELELTYAPPFGSAKDPVNMLGYIAANIMEGITDTVQWYQIENLQDEGYQLLDVRSEGEIKRDGSLPHSTEIPLDNLRDRLDELDLEKAYITSCQSGLRSYLAERILRQSGVKEVKNLDGAFKLYSTVYPDKIIK